MAQAAQQKSRLENRAARQTKTTVYVWMLRSERKSQPQRPRFKKKRTWGTLRIALGCESKKTSVVTVNCLGPPAQGNTFLRMLLVEAAQGAVRCDAGFQNEYLHRCHRKPKGVAKVAAARKSAIN
jgi:hypothetical protein